MVLSNLVPCTAKPGELAPQPPMRPGTGGWADMCLWEGQSAEE